MSDESLVPEVPDNTVPDDTVPDDTVPQRAEGVLTAFLDGEAVLYLVDQARPVLLNTTAAAVWAAIDGTATVAEIATLLADLYEIDPSEVYDDVKTAVRRLRELRLTNS